MSEYPRTPHCKPCRTSPRYRDQTRTNGLLEKLVGRLDADQFFMVFISNLKESRYDRTQSRCDGLGPGRSCTERREGGEAGSRVRFPQPQDTDAHGRKSRRVKWTNCQRRRLHRRPDRRIDPSLCGSAGRTPRWQIISPDSRSNSGRDRHPYRASLLHRPDPPAIPLARCRRRFDCGRSVGSAGLSRKRRGAGF
jgi:hypothetical protein